MGIQEYQVCLSGALFQALDARAILPGHLRALIDFSILTVVLILLTEDVSSFRLFALPVLLCVLMSMGENFLHDLRAAHSSTVAGLVVAKEQLNAELQNSRVEAADEKAAAAKREEALVSIQLNLVMELDDLREELQEVNERSRKENSQHETAKVSLLTDIEAQRKDLEQAQQKVAEYQCAHAALAADLDSLRRELEQKTKRSCEKAFEHNRSLASAEAKHADEILKLQQELKEIQVECNRWIGESDRLTHSLRSIEEMNKHLTNSVKFSQEENARSHEQIAEHNRCLAFLESKYAKEALKLQQELKETAGHCTRWSAESDRLAHSLRTTEEMNEQLTGSVKLLQEENAKCRNDLKAAQEEHQKDTTVGLEKMTDMWKRCVEAEGLKEEALERERANCKERASILFSRDVYKSLWENALSQMQAPPTALKASPFSQSCPKTHDYSSTHNPFTTAGKTSPFSQSFPKTHDHSSTHNPFTTAGKTPPFSQSCPKTENYSSTPNPFTTAGKTSPFSQSCPKTENYSSVPNPFTTAGKTSPFSQSCPKTHDCSSSHNPFTTAGKTSPFSQSYPKTHDYDSTHNPFRDEHQKQSTNHTTDYFSGFASKATLGQQDADPKPEDGKATTTDIPVHVCAESIKLLNKILELDKLLNQTASAQKMQSAQIDEMTSEKIQAKIEIEDLKRKIVELELIREAGEVTPAKVASFLAEMCLNHVESEFRKKAQKSLLFLFHPDKLNGSVRATQLIQELQNHELWLSS